MSSDFESMNAKNIAGEDDELLKALTLPRSTAAIFL